MRVVRWPAVVIAILMVALSGCAKKPITAKPSELKASPTQSSESESISPNGEYLVVVGFDGKRPWACKGLARSHEIDKLNTESILFEGMRINKPVFSSDSRRVAIWCNDDLADNRVGIYEMASGKLIHTLPVLRNRHDLVAFYDDWVIADFCAHNLITNRDVMLDYPILCQDGEDALERVGRTVLWTDKTHILIGGNWFAPEGAEPPRITLLTIYGLLDGTKRDLSADIQKDEYVIGAELNVKDNHLSVDVSDGTLNEKGELERTAVYRSKEPWWLNPKLTEVVRLSKM